MSKRHGDIPANNAEFTAWVNNLLVVVKENTLDSNPPKWEHILLDSVYELENHVEAWNAAYEKSIPPHGSDITAERNDTRAKLEAVLRPFIQRYLYWDPVTNADLERMGLTPHDKTRTQHIEVHELLEFELDLRGIREVLVDFWVKGSTGKAKPQGYDGAVLVWQISDTPLVAPEKFANHTMASRTPHTLYFDAEERGKTVYITMAWQNARGHLGPWSEVQNAIIP